LLPNFRRSALAPIIATKGLDMRISLGVNQKKNPYSHHPKKGEHEEGFGEDEVKSNGSASRINRLIVDDHCGGGRFGIFLTVDGVVNFLAMNRHFLGSNDAKPHLVAPDFYHRDGNVIVNDKALIFFSGQY
jgi:hypothetical protein